jgi:hypothetical protein
MKGPRMYKINIEKDPNMASGTETEKPLDSLAREAEQLKIRIQEEKCKYHDQERKSVCLANTKSACIRGFERLKMIMTDTSCFSCTFCFEDQEMIAV